MTTIAWDGKTLAADTKCVRSGTIGRVEAKIWRINSPNGPALFGGAGSYQDILAVKEWLEAGADETKKPTISDDQVTLLIVASGDCFTLESRLIPIRVMEPFFAIGTGMDFATCAMHLGKSASEAVAIASIFNNSTGGEITVLSLND